MEVKDRNGAIMSLVYYPHDHKRLWHAFGEDGFRFEVKEPAAHMIATLRRLTDAGFDGTVVPGGRWYPMSRDYIEKHFESIGEADWLARVGAEWETVPAGARRRTRKVEQVRKPYCVLGSLAKCLRHQGDIDAANMAEADFEKSLLAKDRLKRLRPLPLLPTATRRARSTCMRSGLMLSLPFGPLCFTSPGRM
jgi:hypothetical protein